VKRRSRGKRQQGLIPVERIARTIVRLRGQNVMRDVDLAALYEVSTKRLNEQVKRNRRRFPQDFMFSVDANGVRGLEVANCDVKFERSWRPPVLALCIFRDRLRGDQRAHEAARDIEEADRVPAARLIRAPAANRPGLVEHHAKAVHGAGHGLRLGNPPNRS
jgi:hypothetical protein